MNAPIFYTSWKPEVLAFGDSNWSGNACRFKNKKDAETYVADLAMRWTLVGRTRVIKSTDPVSCCFVDGRLEFLK